MHYPIITGTIAAMTIASIAIVAPASDDERVWIEKWRNALLISGAGIVLVILSLT
jgi:hypothetical protein